VDAKASKEVETLFKENGRVEERFEDKQKENFYQPKRTQIATQLQWLAQQYVMNLLMYFVQLRIAPQNPKTPEIKN